MAGNEEETIQIWRKGEDDYREEREDKETWDKMQPSHYFESRISEEKTGFAVKERKTGEILKSSELYWMQKGR